MPWIVTRARLRAEMVRFVGHKTIVCNVGSKWDERAAALPDSWARSLLFLYGQSSFVRAHFVIGGPIHRVPT